MQRQPASRADSVSTDGPQFHLWLGAHTPRPDMNIGRWDRIAAGFARTDDRLPVGNRLCDLACELLGTSQASIGLLSGNHFIDVAATDDHARLLVDQQFTLGDGPAFEAARSETPILAPDLASPDTGSRCPAFAPVALELGVTTAFAFPLRVGAARLGVLSAYHHAPIIPDPNTVADAMVLATFVADVLVGLQAGDEQLTEVFNSTLTNGSEVHQAAGMVSEQLGISIVEALVRLRSHAYAKTTPLSVVARSVTQGHLFLEP